MDNLGAALHYLDQEKSVEKTVGLIRGTQSKEKSFSIQNLQQGKLDRMKKFFPRRRVQHSTRCLGRVWKSPSLDPWTRQDTEQPDQALKLALV